MPSPDRPSSLSSDERKLQMEYEVVNTVIEVRHHGSNPWTREVAESIEDALEIAQRWRDSGECKPSDTIEIEFKARGITDGE